VTTFYIYSRNHLVMTTHDERQAEVLASAVRDGSVATVERELTAGERMRDEVAA
jgi:DUF917 family protein